MKHYLFVTLLLMANNCFGQAGHKETQAAKPVGDSLKKMTKENVTPKTVHVSTEKEDPGGIDPGVIAPRDMPEPNKIYTFVEEMPVAGYDTKAYLKANLRYPPAAKENKIQGRVFVKFVVRQDGSITDVTLARGIDEDCDAEARRVIAAMPKWKPGRQNGKAVNTYYSMPVVFTLE